MRSRGKASFPKEAHWSKDCRRASVMDDLMSLDLGGWQLWEEQCLPLPLENEPLQESPGSCGKSRSPSRNAARERTRVRSLRSAFQSLQRSLPAVPPDTKLSKLDVLVLASNYIAHLAHLLQEAPKNDLVRNAEAVNPSYYHPVKKWPMRSRLYAGPAGTTAFPALTPQ